MSMQLKYLAAGIALASMAGGAHANGRLPDLIYIDRNQLKEGMWALSSTAPIIGYKNLEEQSALRLGVITEGERRLDEGGGFSMKKIEQRIASQFEEKGSKDKSIHSETLDKEKEVSKDFEIYEGAESEGDDESESYEDAEPYLIVNETEQQGDDLAEHPLLGISTGVDEEEIKQARELEEKNRLLIASAVEKTEESREEINQSKESTKRRWLSLFGLSRAKEEITVDAETKSGSAKDEIDNLVVKSEAALEEEVKKELSIGVVEKASEEEIRQRWFSAGSADANQIELKTSEHMTAESKDVVREGKEAIKSVELNAKVNTASEASIGEADHGEAEFYLNKKFEEEESPKLYEKDRDAVAVKGGKLLEADADKKGEIKAEQEKSSFWKKLFERNKSEATPGGRKSRHGWNREDRRDRNELDRIETAVRETKLEPGNLTRKSMLLAVAEKIEKNSGGLIEKRLADIGDMAGKIRKIINEVTERVISARVFGGDKEAKLAEGKMSEASMEVTKNEWSIKHSASVASVRVEGEEISPKTILMSGLGFSVEKKIGLGMSVGVEAISLAPFGGDFNVEPMVMIEAVARKEF